MLIYILTAFTVFLFYNFYWKRRNFPPGPTPWPLIGNIMEMAKHKSWPKLYYEWGQKYGGIYTFWLCETPIINITDYETSLELAVQNADAYADRRSTFMEEAPRNGHYGVTMVNGNIWKDHRRFAMKVFRDFGMGKNLMQEKILVEASHIINKLNNGIADTKKEHNIHDDLNVAVGSIINNMLFGYRFTNGREHECLDLSHEMQILLQQANAPLVHVARFFPFALCFPPVKRACQGFYESFGHILKHMQARVDEHKTTTGEINDYVDAYFAEKKKLEAQTGNSGTFTDIQLGNALSDLWFAGHETTTSTLTWSFAFLIHYQHVQKKIHEELDRVIGSSRLITTADKPALPYLNAFINETQRRANIFSQSNIFHAMAKDVTIKGYQFKKGDFVNIEFDAWFEDPKVFQKPDVFLPERFLTENGDLKKVDELIPFGIGRRVCLGESLARMELFLLISNIINHFKVLPGAELPILEKFKSPAATMLKQYHCRFEKRFQV